MKSNDPWKGWSYLESVYFSIISLTKVGFGDFVPHTQPADKWAMLVSIIQKFLWQNDILRHKHNKTRCISALVSTSPRTGASEFKRLFDACAGQGSPNTFTHRLLLSAQFASPCLESTWSPEVERCFVLYRVLIFFWILFGITFTCSVIHLTCRSINVFLL